MAPAPRLEQRQVQRLALTQELQRSLELLRLDCVELASYLAREIEANPLLEAETASPLEETNLDLPVSRLPVDRDLTASVFTNDSFADLAGMAPARDPFERGGGLSLNQHVHNQIPLLRLPAEESLIANYLADSLTEAGYLASTLAEAAGNLGATEARVAKVLKKLQTLEPAGIFARDLPECLALQLREKGLLTPSAEAVLAHLDLVAAGKTAELAKRCRLGEAALARLLAAIRRLDPKPGLAFSTAEPVQSVVPDIMVSRGRRGRFRVELNTETLPKILVNETFARDVAGEAQAPAARQFLKDCQARAGWLKRALASRAETLLKVAEALVAAQQDFFEKGVRFLKPMTLRTLGETLDLHESTISRAISHKYIATPRGLFRLRYFFSAALPGTGEGRTDTAARGAKERLGALIAAEDKARPLSDGDLAAALRQEGFALARRTVVKYREALRIPSSYRRRASKNA
ncbi:MAG TPA: RNA polymerase factor sigma-54 [Sphingomonadales bacterium]|nr:RNA polymerase factor sigma-54 [Sphingomonadales bacterium]